MKTYDPKALIGAAAAAMAALSAAPASALAEATPSTVRVGEVEFPTRLRASGHALTLRGQGEYRYLSMFRAFSAAYYEAAVPASGASGARRLAIVYSRAFSADDFAWATRKGIRQNLGDGRYRALEARIERFNALYRSVRPGDGYTLTWIPGQGTTLALNGEDIGAVAGDDFAAAIFSIWLGPKPIDDALRAALLGQ